MGKSEPLSHEYCVEILNLTYSRIMRLKFSYMFLCTMIADYHTVKYFPNLCWNLKVSFVTDAYTTVNSIYSSGQKSLQHLRNNDVSIQDVIRKSKSTISKIIPDFENYRNQMFCHLNKQYESEAINSMANHFESVLDELCHLHAECCKILSVTDDELNGYYSETFTKLQQEAHDFCDVLMHGNFDKMSEDLNNKLDAIMRGEKHE